MPPIPHVAFGVFGAVSLCGAGEQLALALDDHDTLAKVRASMAASQKALVDDKLLWNATSKFFRCHTSSTWQTYVKGGAPGVYTNKAGFLSAGNDFQPETNVTYTTCKVGSRATPRRTVPRHAAAPPAAFARPLRRRARVHACLRDMPGGLSMGTGCVSGRSCVWPGSATLGADAGVHAPAARPRAPPRPLSMRPVGMRLERKVPGVQF